MQLIRSAAGKPTRIIEAVTDDPILNDPNCVQVLTHYMGPDILALAQAKSPYAPNSGTEQYRKIYDRIAEKIRPLCAREHPDTAMIIQSINKELPIVNLPKWVQKRIEQVEQQDREQAALHKNWRPTGDRKVGNWTMPDEPEEAAWSVKVK